MHERTKQQALKALEGMREIVRAEMLVRGDYVSQEIVAPERVGNAICNGRSFCAIGSLWAGGGVKVVEDDTTLAKSWTLPGVGEGRERDEFLRNRHGLRAAYDALNDASERYAARHKIELDGTFVAPIEALFEGACYFIDDENREFELDRSDLLKIIKSARQQIVRA